MEAESFYSVLGVDEDASSDEIRRRYRQLCLIHHPDKVQQQQRQQQQERQDGEGKAHSALFDKIAQAYKCLADGTRRAQYDAERAQATRKQELPFHDEIGLGDMDHDDGEGVFYYECRCGGEYVLDSSVAAVGGENYDPPPWIVPCDTCTFAIKISNDA